MAGGLTYPLGTIAVVQFQLADGAGAPIAGEAGNVTAEVTRQSGATMVNAGLVAQIAAQGAAGKYICWFTPDQVGHYEVTLRHASMSIPITETVEVWEKAFDALAQAQYTMIPL